MYFHTDNEYHLHYLANLLKDAANQGGTIRIDVDDAGRLKVKAGEGMWSAPFYSTSDPYRD